MSESYFRFRVGEFDCIAINDCRDLQMTFSARSSLSNAPDEALTEATRAHGFEPDEWEQNVHVNCLLVDLGGRLILFDVGMGSPDLIPGTGKLRSALESAGISASAVDTVIFTHGHWDHVAGIADDSGTLLFPNANYMMQRDEWGFWTDRGNIRLLNPNQSEFDQISFEKLPLIRERVQLFDPEGELLPGITTIAVPGHTPGHTAFSIRSGNDELLHISDLTHNDLHFEYPKWHHEVDILPELSYRSRQKVFTRAASNNILTFGCHTSGPAHGVGHIESQGEAWKWRPLSHNSD